MHLIDMKKITDSLSSYIAKHLTKLIFIILLAMLISMFYIDYSAWVSEKFKNNFSIVSSTIVTTVICLVSYIAFTAYLGKKYSLRIDKLSLGGLNILFEYLEKQNKELFKELHYKSKMKRAEIESEES